ncbi:hypothetical protein FCOIX_10060, partial [Fusarium coicis]
MIPSQSSDPLSTSHQHHIYVKATLGSWEIAAEQYNTCCNLLSNKAKGPRCAVFLPKHPLPSVSCPKGPRAMSDEVSQFLEQVERLRGQQIEEDETRARELEEYLAAKRERQARRE